MARRIAAIREVPRQVGSKRQRKPDQTSITKPSMRPRTSPRKVRATNKSTIYLPTVQPVAEDDLCPVCQQLLYIPVVTGCQHHLCQSCMIQWAEVSAGSQMVIRDVDDEIDHTCTDPAIDIEVHCPMCRTQTSATIDHKRARRLAAEYPDEYAARTLEDQAEAEAAKSGTASSVHALTLFIGNRHENTAEPSPSGEQQQHQCLFFVRPSRTDIIEEVQIQLPTMSRPSRIIRTRPPYEVGRTVQHPLPVLAHVILKAGYSWLSSDAEDSPDGAKKGTLPVEWQLDFTRYNGKGSMGRMRLKAMQEGGNSTADNDNQEEDRELQRDRKAWERTVREYQRDGLWRPDESDEG